MKRILNALTGIILIALVSCGNDGNKTENHDMKGMGTDTAGKTIMEQDTTITEVTPAFNNVDTKMKSFMGEIVNHYLQVKNALANDNSRGASKGAEAMEDVLDELDKSLFTAEQKTVYDQNEEELKEHAEHIRENGDNIRHQRSHFSMMSEVMYELVKAFGASRPVYHSHCPMYNENKGAMWLSETREIKNPYFGSEMPTCGTVMEIIK